MSEGGDSHGRDRGRWGQAGLAVSQRLVERGLDHVVLERGLIGDSWRTRRWDSFHLVSPNWANTLPGQPPVGRYDEFATAARFVDAMTRYAGRLGLPVRENQPAVTARRDGPGYVVETPDATYRARSLVVASGFQWHPKLPDLARQVPVGVASLHSSRYRRPEALPAGAVLVVGAAQSGMQIALELAKAGRRVFLCTSEVRRLPRRYRGRDMYSWWRAMGFLDHRPEDLPDPAAMHLPIPVWSGAGGGYSLSLQLLAPAGVTLLGRLDRIDEGRLRLAGDRDANIAYGDESAAVFRRQVDEFLGDHRSTYPETGTDPADEPIALPPAPRDLDLATAEIGAVIWCTGYLPHHPWLAVPTGAPDLYVVGKPWLTRRSSAILYGIPTDAAVVAARIAGPPRSARGGGRLPAPRMADATAGAARIG